MRPPSSLNNPGLARLLAVVATTAVVWLVVLPRVGKHPEVRTRINHNQQLGIDPSAKFYTELPLMDRVRVVQRALTFEREGTDEKEER